MFPQQGGGGKYPGGSKGSTPRRFDDPPPPFPGRGAFPPPVPDSPVEREVQQWMNEMAAGMGPGAGSLLSDPQFLSSLLPALRGADSLYQGGAGGIGLGQQPGGVSAGLAGSYTGLGQTAQLLGPWAGGLGVQGGLSQNPFAQQSPQPGSAEEAAALTTLLHRHQLLQQMGNAVSGGGLSNSPSGRLLHQNNDFQNMQDGGKHRGGFGPMQQGKGGGMKGRGKGKGDGKQQKGKGFHDRPESPTMGGRGKGGGKQEDRGKFGGNMNKGGGVGKPMGSPSSKGSNKGFVSQYGGGKGGGKDQGGGGYQGQGGKGMSLDSLPPNCSQTLYEFRMRGVKKELHEILPHLEEFCRDQYGSRLIQQKLQVAAAHEKSAFFGALKQHVKELVLDPFANYVVQKFFERGNREQREGLAVELKGKVLELSYHVFGCWVMQRLLECLDTNPELQLELAHELEPELLKLVVNQNGNHVIQAAVENMPPENTQFIVRALVGHAGEMARHTYGCRVLQRIVERCSPQDVEPIMAEIIPDLEELVRDEYGNYVVQSVAERTSVPNRAAVIDFVSENLVKLATNKYASNVCEKALMFSGDADVERLTEIILGSDEDPEPPILMMVRHRYANYCVQKMLEKIQVDSPFVERCAKRLRNHIPQIRTYVYGRHILQSLARLNIIRPEEIEGPRVRQPRGAEHVRGPQRTPR
ncbi:unnamed protein product [Amoebophrya sp. A25]|nr:unnamed protein product [Amoebophrya sp. A25]|eukprot:GSA25T00024677001.1